MAKFESADDRVSRERVDEIIESRRRIEALTKENAELLRRVAELQDQLDIARAEVERYETGDRSSS